MKELFQIGPFTVHFFGVMIAIGILSGFVLFISQVKRRNLNEKILIDGVLYSLIGGVIGARLIFVLVYNPTFYFSNPMEIVFLHKGGLSIHGGILGGLLVGFLFLKKHKISVSETLDIVAPSLILAQAISRIGCDVFGGPLSANVPWSIEYKGEMLHPAQAYEFILNYLLFGYLWLRLKRVSYHGQVFVHYLIGFLVIRGIVEFTRINPMVFGPFSVSHVMSLIGIIFALLLAKTLKRQKVEIINQEINKDEIAKTAAIVISLITVSLFIYYTVQG